VSTFEYLIQEIERNRFREERRHGIANLIVLAEMLFLESSLAG